MEKKTSTHGECSIATFHDRKVNNPIIRFCDLFIPLIPINKYPIKNG